MIGLAAVAEPLVSFLLTDKWLGTVLLLQILCLDWMLDHLSQINLNLLLIKGRSDLSLRLEIVKKIIATLILIISIPYGIEIMCWGRVLYSVLATYMNSYYTNRLIGLSLKTQLRDIFPSLLLAAGMGIIVYYSISLFSSDLLKIIGGVVIGVVFYVMASVILRIGEFKELSLIIKK